MAEASTFIANPFFYSILVPFLLVFVIVYAILEKTNILGEGKKMVNLIVSFSIAFIFIGVPAIVNITLRIIPIVSFIIILLLCLLLLFGFAGVDTQKSKLLKIILGIVLGIALVVTILWATGVLGMMSGTLGSGFLSYVVFFIIFIIVIVAVLLGGKKPSSS
jgi:hypothetical protein